VVFHFADEFFYQFSHHFLTFLTVYLAALPIVCWAGKTDIVRAAKVLTFGFLIIWTPPIVDEIISRGAGLWSFYSFDSLLGLLERYLTFFGDKPDIGITYGVRFEVGTVVLGVLLYSWLKTRSFWRAGAGALLLYTALFIIGVLPSLITIAVFGIEKGFLAVTEQDIARYMLSPRPLYILNPPDIASTLAINMSLVYGVLLVPLASGLAFAFFRPTLLALWRNARLPQMVYHAGLFIVGAGFASLYSKLAFETTLFHILGFILLIIAIECAWLASVVQNDFRDQAIDRLSNPDRPLVTGSIDPPLYSTIGLLLFAASIFLAALVSTQAALLLMVYQAIAFLYSADPLRLKRIPFVATALASAASLLIFFAGFIVFSADKNIEALPVHIPVFLFITYLFLLPIKDFKDIAGDRADGVITIPVLLGEARAKRFIGAILFLTFVSSVFVFAVRSLFPLALFFGALAYWLLHWASLDHPIFPYRRLAAWYVALTGAYVLFLGATILSR
jgi:4-hydroxybenzoate polyprenyltransferase